jgi:hypothetical protein
VCLPRAVNAYQNALDLVEKTKNMIIEFVSQIRGDIRSYILHTIKLTHSMQRFETPMREKHWLAANVRHGGIDGSIFRTVALDEGYQVLIGKSGTMVLVIQMAKHITMRTSQRAAQRWTDNQVQAAWRTKQSVFYRLLFSAALKKTQFICTTLVFPLAKN